MKNFLTQNLKKITTLNFMKIFKYNNKMESKPKENESEIYFISDKISFQKEDPYYETNDIKFPTFDDPYIEEHVKKDITYESLISDLKSCDEALNNFSLQYDSLFNSANSQMIKKKFSEHNLNHSTYKLFAFFLTRQITLVYYLLEMKFSSKTDQIQNISDSIRKNFVDVDHDLMIQDFFTTNNKYFLINEDNDNPQEYDKHIQVIKLFKTLIKNESDIIQFDSEDEKYLPSISSISISLIILKSVLDNLTFQLKELQELRDINEDYLIQFFHNCNKLELFTNYFILSYKIPHDDIFNQSENSDSWIKFKNHSERRVVYSRHVLNKKLQQVFDMIILGNASVSKGHNEFDSKYLRILGSGWYMAYFFFNKKKANIQSIKFAINPNFEIAHKIWNMLDAKGIRNLLKLTMPRIKYSKKWYLKKTENIIDLEKIKELNERIPKYSVNIERNNDSSLNSNVEKICNSKNKNFDDLVLKNINKEISDNYVKVRIISHKNFFVPTQKSFVSNFFSCCAVEKNFFRDSLIIHIHGGGFIAMSASSHENYTRKWATKLEVPVFSIDYRLAPEYPYPCALDDVYQSYMWIIKYSEQILNMNVKNIILTGDSAGGNLAAALTYLLILENKKLPTALFLTYPGILFIYLC